MVSLYWWEHLCFWLEQCLNICVVSGGGELDRLSNHLQASGVSPRSSSRSQISMRRLNPIRESRSAGEQPAAPGGDVSDERGPGGLRTSSLAGRKASVPAPRRHSSHRGDDEEPADSEGEGEETVRAPRLPPPQGWVQENQDLRGSGAGNPLLRHSSQGSRGSGRPWQKEGQRDEAYELRCSGGQTNLVCWDKHQRHRCQLN